MLSWILYNLDRIVVVVGLLGKVMLAFFICLIGFIGAAVGYNLLDRSLLTEYSEILLVFLFYLIIFIVAISSKF